MKIELEYIRCETFENSVVFAWFLTFISEGCCAYKSFVVKPTRKQRKEALREARLLLIGDK